MSGAPDWRTIAHDLAWSQGGERHTEAEQTALDRYDDAVELERRQTSARPDALPLLTPGEHEAIRLLGKAFTVWSKEGVTGKDLDEFAAIIHHGQHMVMAQAAARAYPDLYRLARGTHDGDEVPG